MGLFYFSGITPAISLETEKAVTEACAYCVEHEIPVVCDLNYRGKMWSAAKAQEVMNRLMPYVSICIANDEDFEAALGIKAFDSDMAEWNPSKESFKEGMLKVTRCYPHCQIVASVLRQDIHSRGR